MTERPHSVTIIRHAEKPSGERNSPRGVNERGDQRPDSLTPRGWQRAGALAVLLGGGEVPQPFLRPSVLYTCGYPDNPDGSRHRPRETITPLAEKLGLEIQVPKLKTQGAELMREDVLKQAGQDVLICWEHHNIPEMVTALAQALRISEIPAAGRHWPDDDFHTALIFTRREGHYGVQQVREGVLGGS